MADTTMRRTASPLLDGLALPGDAECLEGLVAVGRVVDVVDLGGLELEEVATAEDVVQVRVAGGHLGAGLTLLVTLDVGDVARDLDALGRLPVLALVGGIAHGDRRAA